jgi:hypothetical protein
MGAVLVPRTDWYGGRTGLDERLVLTKNWSWEKDWSGWYTGMGAGLVTETDWSQGQTGMGAVLVWTKDWY